MIILKSAEEIEEMAKSGSILIDVFRSLNSFIRPGISTLDIANECERIIRKAGAYPTFLHYGTPPFPGSVCVSVDSEVVHGIPKAKRVIKEGQIVSVDIGATLNGWVSDAARTFCVGEVRPEVRQLVRETENSFWEGIKEFRPGNRVGDISHAIQEHARKFHYGIVEELTGHGVGRNLHEDPNVLNYGKAGRGPRLEVGMTLAIEPMLNLGSKKIAILDDDWTIVTADGSVSAHYENSCALTENGVLVLTHDGDA